MSRKTIVLFGVALIIAIGALSWRERDAPRSAQATIVLTENGFEPSTVEISRGGSVSFTTTAKRPFWPASNLHPDHSIYAEFDPKRPLQPYEEWSFMFEKVGEWGFHDHVRSYYSGTVKVK